MPIAMPHACLIATPLATPITKWAQEKKNRQETSQHSPLLLRPSESRRIIGHHYMHGKIEKTERKIKKVGLHRFHKRERRRIAFAGRAYIAAQAA